MNKPLLALAALAVLGVASMTAQVTIEGSDTEYTSVSEAVKTLTDATPVTIHVNSSYTETASIAITENNTRNITIVGDNGVVISYGGIILFNQGDRNSSITLENLTLSYTGKGENGRSTINIGRGSLSMRNVTIENASVTNVNGVISLNNGNSNIPDAVFNNVKLVNCIASSAPALVVANNSNVSLSGNTEFSILLKGQNTIKNASAFTGNVTIVFDAERTVGSVIVKNCSDRSHFALKGVNGKMLKVEGGNLVLAEENADAVVINDNTGTGYADLPAAVGAATSGQTLILNQNVTLTDALRLRNKILTIKGATGSEVITLNHAKSLLNYTNTDNGGQPDYLTLENLTIDGNNEERPASLLEPGYGGSATLNNVNIRNVNYTGNNAIIRNNSNAGTWRLNGVTFENCTAKNQLVLSNVAGNSIAGNNSFTLRVNVPNSVDAAGIVKGSNIDVTVGSPAMGAVIFTNCPAENPFVCATKGYYFGLNEGNLVLTDGLTAAGAISFGSRYAIDEYSHANVLVFKPQILLNGNPDPDILHEYNVYLGEENLGEATAEGVSYFAYDPDARFTLRSTGKTLEVNVEWPVINCEPRIIKSNFIKGTDGDVTADYTVEPVNNSRHLDWSIEVNDGYVYWNNANCVCRFENAGYWEGSVITLNDEMSSFKAAVTYPFAVRPAAAAYADGDENYEIRYYRPAEFTTLSTTAADLQPGEGNTSGVADVAVEQDGEVELFNLQGVRVEGEPAPGLYIRRQGTVVTKILVK